MPLQQLEMPADERRHALRVRWERVIPWLWTRAAK